MQINKDLNMEKDSGLGMVWKKPSWKKYADIKVYKNYVFCMQKYQNQY